MENNDHNDDYGSPSHLEDLVRELYEAYDDCHKLEEELKKVQAERDTYLSEARKAFCFIADNSLTKRGVSTESGFHWEPCTLDGKRRMKWYETLVIEINKLEKSKEELDKAYTTILAALENGSDETIWPSGTPWYEAAAKIINEEKYSFIDRNMERREKEGARFPTREEVLDILKNGGADRK